MNDEFQISLYFLSALSQSMAALLAIGGVFAIYQFQKIENQIDHTCNAFKSYVKETQPGINQNEPARWLNKDVKVQLLCHFKALKDANPINLLDGFVDYFTQLESQEDFAAKLKNWLWIPTISIGLTFLWALLALSRVPPSGLSDKMLMIMFGIGAFALISLIGYIFIVIRGPREFVFNNPQKSVKYDYGKILIDLFPTIMNYNLSSQTTSAENTLNVKFVRYAKRNPKYSSSLRGKSSDSLRGNVVDSSFLQKNQFEKTDSRQYPYVSTKPKISFFGIDRSFVVRDHHGTQTDQQDRDIAVQRIFPGDSWVELFPGTNDVAKIFEAIESADDPAIGQTARQSARVSVGIAQEAHQPDLRYRFGGDYDLRQATRRSGWIQSQKERTMFVPSVVLLRGAPAGILAWNPASGQRQFLYGNHRVLEDLSGQSAVGYRPKPHSFSHGFWILRIKNHPIPRRVWLRLHDRGQRILSDQDSGAAVPIPKIPKRLGSRRILREHQSKVEQPAPLYRGAAPHSRRPAGSQTTQIVQRHQIHLSYLRHQSQNVSLASLSVLLSPSHHRKKQSRISLRLSSRQDSYSYLEFQRRFFPIAFVLGQYCSLVQETLSAPRIFDRHLGYDSHRLPGSSGQVDQSRSSKDVDSSQRLYSARRIRRGLAQNPKIASAQKFPFLQVTYSTLSTTQLGEIAFSRIFEDNPIIGNDTELNKLREQYLKEKGEEMLQQYSRLKNNLGKSLEKLVHGERAAMDGKFLEKAVQICTIGAFLLIFWQIREGNEQTKLFRGQVSSLNKILVFQLADRCLWPYYDGGDRASYFTLLDMKVTIDDRSLKKVIEGKLKEIKERYQVSERFVSQQRAVCKLNVPHCTETEQPGDFTLKNVLDHMKYPEPISRARAAYLLGTDKKYLEESIKKDNEIQFSDILKELIKHIDENQETSLLVSKTALDSFVNLTGYRRNDVFDFAGALEYGKNQLNLKE